MAKNFKIIKQKRVVTWLRKAMLYVTIPLYLSLIAVVGAVILTLALCKIDGGIFDTVTACLGGFIALLSLAVAFIVIPLCRAKQALLDMKNYDFSPCTPNETETFSHKMQTEKYYFTPSPFDDDEGITELKSGKAVDDYFSQFAPERLKIVEELRIYGEFIPFTVIYYGDDYFQGTVEKRKEGEYITVTVTETAAVSFLSDGVHCGEKVFPYGQCEAIVYAGFVQPYASAAVGVYLILSDECAANFAFGARIMSVIDKHGISVKNPETANYILADPKKAFKKIGLRGRLKNLKK